MTPAESSVLVGTLAAAFPARRITTETVRAYAKFLGDLETAAATRSVEYLIKTEEFFPSIGKIRRTAYEISSGLPSAEAAWSIARAAVREHPEVDTVIVDDEGLPPIVRETMADLPARDILRGDSFARGHFLTLYGARLEEAFRIENLPALAALAGPPAIGDGR